MTVAACWGTDPEQWFPEDNRRPDPALVAICNTCPIKQECADFAKRNPVYGIWAGHRYTTVDMKRADPRHSVQPLKPCGTEAAYLRHKRKKEQCDVCDKIRADNRVAAAQQAQAARRMGIPRNPLVRTG